MYSKVYVKITNICNMNCSFCRGHKRVARRMSREEFLLILDKLSGITGYIYYHIMGEPLTHPELPEFISLANGRGFKSVITTNGTLIKARGDELLSSGVNKVNISLHSFENGSEEDYEEYVKSLADFAIRAAELGIITVFRLWNKGYDGGRNDVAFNLLRRFIDGEWADNTRGVRIRDKIHLEWGERFEWPDGDADVKGDAVRCYGLGDHFGILCDGTVVPCCLDSEGAINLGNIFTEDLASILASQRAVAIARGFRCGKAVEELCKRCGYAARFT